MSTKLVRIPLAWPIGERSASQTTKDPYIYNGVLEKYGDKLYVMKRPGTQAYDTLGPGGGSQGVTYYNGLFWGIVNDSLYRQAGALLAGADGSAWTQSTAPTWPGVVGQGGTVFNNRMWLIGGATTAAGVWSTVDGINWVVNAGGQPWGFRSSMGCVTFNDKMWVIGGLNLTFITTFNDVWSTDDGTNWTMVSAPGVAPWTARYRHGAVATNNGMYIMGGLDSNGGSKLNDVWYSADGVEWAELTSAASWSARDGLQVLWYNNLIWVIGGRNSAGVVQNDVWYSPDGITWTQATAAAFATGRMDMQVCVYRNLMWVMGGASPGVTAQVYTSSDGVTWTLVTAAPGWTGRSGGKALVFRVPSTVSTYPYDTMWMIGGSTGFTSVAEVWRANLNVSAPTSFALVTTLSGQQYQFTTFLNGALLLFKNLQDFYVLQGSTVVKVTDRNYPPLTVPGLVSLNAFVYVMTPTGEIHACKLEDPTQWPSLQFVTADYENDAGVCLAKHLNYVVALGQWTTQFFYDNGANQPVGSPLAPYINANLRVGCVSAASVASVDNNLYWVAQTENGGRSVVRLQGLQIQTISTPYVDKILMETSISGYPQMRGFNMSVAGHQYYVLITSALNRALVFDTTFNEWYEWDKFPYADFVTNFATNGTYLWGQIGGTLSQILPTLYTDVLGGTFSFYCQTDKIDHGNTAQKFCGRAVLVGDRSTAQPTITYSDDDYASYVNAGTVNMNLGRPYLTRLGPFRRRAWKPVQTDNYPARWEALEVEYSQGES